MDDLPGPRGTKSSSSAAASRYAIEAGRVRTVRRIHPFDPRQVSLRTFYRASGYPRPMTRFTTDIQMRFRDIDGLGHVNSAVSLSFTQPARPQSYIDQSRTKNLEETD